MIIIPIEELRLRPEVAEKLLNRDLVQRTYQTHTIKDAAKVLGCGHKTFRKAMAHHGIAPRSKGMSPGITRDDIKRAAMRAYLKSDRCPPSCPGRDSCLDGKCTLRDYC